MRAIQEARKWHPACGHPLVAWCVAGAVNGIRDAVRKFNQVVKVPPDLLKRRVRVTRFAGDWNRHILPEAVTVEIVEPTVQPVEVGDLREEFRAAVRRAMGPLTERETEYLALRHYDGKTLEEMAAADGTSPATVHHWLRRVYERGERQSRGELMAAML